MSFDNYWFISYSSHLFCAKISIEPSVLRCCNEVLESSFNELCNFGETNVDSLDWNSSPKIILPTNDWLLE